MENKHSQAPDYFKLIEVLTKMGYEVVKFNKITPESKNYEVPKCIYELRIVKNS